MLCLLPGNQIRSSQIIGRKAYEEDAGRSKERDRASDDAPQGCEHRFVWWGWGLIGLGKE